MKLSHQITHITPGGSDGWEVFNRARQMMAQGIGVTELTIGEHDIRTDPAILNAMHKAALDGHTGYAAIPGTLAFRETVAARLTERTGVHTGPENVLITPGGQAALFAAHKAVCDPGDTALFIDPYYATYPGKLRAVGAIPRAVATRAETGFQPEPQAIADAAGDAVSLLVNSPNNPTGAIYGPATFDGIAEVCQDRDLWLISDEVYDTQIWEGRHISPRALPGMADRTLVVGSMSKSHAMTGSRIGWLAGPEDAISHVANLLTHTTYGVPGFIQDAADWALNQGTGLEETIAAPFRRRRRIALDVLAGQNVVGVVPPGGAMYLMLDIRPTGLSGEDFAFALLDRHRIAVMPGESFGQAASGHLRVAMTIPDEDFARALETICAFAAELAEGRQSRVKPD